MSKVDKNTLRNIVHLSRLETDEQKENQVLEDFNRILTWIDMLDEIDTGEIAPLTHMTLEVNQMREDVVKEPLDHEKGLLNAPHKDSDYFRVPKVLETE
ncbi:MAG: Asp-tRNA(Asn)/Glu-tRNA(Gln) amidotransferase subunit GatC [Cytophagales bacterium]|nr:MAG: Asp-tRNA(Asn)/Glu-tRNA(Gln) amidotransferase subunit GatC [Cytophagales bacterium]